MRIGICSPAAFTPSSCTLLKLARQELRHRLYNSHLLSLFLVLSFPHYYFKQRVACTISLAACSSRHARVSLTAACAERSSLHCPCARQGCPRKTKKSNQTKPNQTSMGRRPENSKSKANPSEESGGKSRWKNKTSEGSEERNQEPTPDKPSNWVFRCEKKNHKGHFCRVRN